MATGDDGPSGASRTATHLPAPAETASPQKGPAPELAPPNVGQTADPVRARSSGPNASRLPGDAPGEDVTPSTKARLALGGHDGPFPQRIGAYEVVSELGSGGMAVVYQAVQPSLGRKVAIKTLRHEFVHDRQLRTRFEREAQSLATLQHGNIVHVYDYLESTNSAHIVMEYVDGVDLFELLRDKSPFPTEVAALIAWAIAEGLEHAHFSGIVHRDVKPSNVLLSRRGEVKLMDFGIARDPGRSELTQVGLAVGTPAYMAPEQIRGDRIGPAVDIFALGVVLYEMLAGSKPWPEEDGRSVTVRVLDESPVPLSRVAPSAPDELVRIVHDCLEKDPAHRHASSHAIRRALERYVDSTVQEPPRARLVVFLKNRGILAEQEAEPLASRDLLTDPELARRDRGEPPIPPSRLLRPVFRGLASSLALIAIAGTLIATAPFGTRLSTDPPRVHLGAWAPSPSPTLHPADPAPPMGELRVVVRPWARVLIDGRFYDFTPFADPILLPPGDHRIGLRNPFYEPTDHIVNIEAGEQETLKVALIPLAETEP